MKTKITLVAVTILALAVLVVHAITLKLPPIPTPKLGVGDAVKVVNDYFRTNGWTEEFLVGVDWCRADQFQPRLRDGGQYIIDDAKEEWSWFFTYVGSGLGARTNEFSEVNVVRLRNNGQI